MRVRLEEEAEQSQTIMEEIDAKWAAIVELKVPQEIAEEIQKQEDQCAKVVKAKARVLPPGVQSDTWTLLTC